MTQTDEEIKAIMESIAIQTSFTQKKTEDKSFNPLSKEELVELRVATEDGGKPQEKQKSQRLRINDWAHTPVHAMVIEGRSAEDALTFCTPERGITLLKQAGRGPGAAKQGTSWVATDVMALSQFFAAQISLHELDYISKTVSVPSLSDEEQQQLYTRLNCTYLQKLAFVGQIDTFEKISKIYLRESYLNRPATIQKFMDRCRKADGVLEGALQVMKALKRYKISWSKLSSKLPEEKKDPSSREPAPDADQMERSLTQFAQHTWRLFSQIRLYMRECALHANLNHHLDVFIYEGVDLRDSMRSNLARVIDHLKASSISIPSIVSELALEFEK